MSERILRLLLIEDDRQLGPLIERVLSEYYDVELVVDGREGLTAGMTGTFDVMVVDRRLPALDGLSVVQGLRSARIVCPILVLTALGSLSDKVDGLDAGANDYLVKPFDFEELLARLRALTRTFSAVGPMVEIDDWAFYPMDNCIYSPHIGRVLLTPRESELLALFAQNPDRTFSRREVLRVVFSSEDQPGTVDTYVHYLRHKTDKDVVLTVRGRGYRLGRL
jgi:two-component system response regulator QseB